MEPESSLPSSQESSTGQITEPVHTSTSYLCNIHFSIIHTVA
jgi:hypothetical protein